ncbi:NTP transferase domain-containing protein [Altererythrobacter confluentis]|uniref:NTP transferase domain-containing protein n=1 Tax=Allopontixanthobacter confluentis TaxID=1849021 RepID=A0A6L7GCH8_9SPHN|nr:NTP transferase domain-containing protein [Allopontixanthobacter confluentis]
MIQPVILCGGSGTRLWPRSRVSRPKPFVPLVGELTLFEAALDRVADRQVFAPPIVVAGPQHVSFIEAQAGHIDGLRIIVEPVGRNTAPAIALAASILAPGTIMLVCPSDHHIADKAAFIHAAQSGAVLAGDSWLVAIGVKADRPETGYGYIRIGEPLGAGASGSPQDGPCHMIDRFVEKPDAARAAEFLADGGYCWNAGIFVFGAGAYLESLAHNRPDMAQNARLSLGDAQGGNSRGESRQEGRPQGRSALIHPDSTQFSSITGESVDYAVMENAEKAAVVVADMGWSDIGNWRALRDARTDGGGGNSVTGTADLIGCRNVMVDSDGPRVSVVGLDDIIVVVDGNDILVVSASAAQDVGKLPGAAGA